MTALILQLRFIPSYCEELHIVIDTDASNSISPKASDFVGEVKRSDLSSLKQENGTTPIYGEGNIGWNIKDSHGTCRSVISEACFIPSTTI